MGRFWKLMAIVIVTSIVLLCLSLAQAPSSSREGVEVAGMPVACIGRPHPCWIAVTGTGVIVLGAGAGVVEFGLYGAGILFGTGQLCVGLIAMGQLGLGLVLFAGQVGGGLLSFGQGVTGWLSVRQGGQQRDGRDFLAALRADLHDLFAWRGRG